MNLIQYLTNKFYSQSVERKRYVEHEPFIKQFKAQKGKSRTNISQFVELNSLDYIMVDTDGNVLDSDIADYHYKKHKILISIDSIISSEQLAPLVQQSYAEAAASAVAEIEAAQQASVDAIADATMVQTDTKVAASDTLEATVGQPTQYDLIELTDDEAFKDTNDNPVSIEVRGVRTETGILFRAKHIREYLGMKNLTRSLHDDRYGYKKDVHWVKLYQYSNGICTTALTGESPSNNVIDTVIDSQNVSSTDKLPEDKAIDSYSASLTDHWSANPTIEKVAQKPIWSRMYLTLPGLLKVIFSSRAANENMMQLHKWIIHLVFVHKFGSPTERMDLVESLTPYRKCLNKLSGIYLIRIGKVKDLRESMSISKDLYPSSKFDSTYVFKFGRSDDIMTRFKQHCERTGYGKYSSTISMEWFVVIPPELCSNAENDLSKYFDLHQFKFRFNDGSKDHTELIIVKPGTEKKHTKDKYFELVKSFPSGSNAIIQQMTELKQGHDQTIDRMNLYHENELLKVRSESDKKDLAHQVELLTERSDTKDLAHQVALLKIQSDSDKKDLALLKIQSDSDKKDLAHQVELLQLKLELARK